jgi:hypothetical protein
MKVILGLLFLFTFAAYNTASSDEGQIRVVAKSMQTNSSGGGLLRNCVIDFEIHNGIGSKIKRLSAAVTPKTSDEFDQNVVGAAGDQRFYFRKLETGTTVDDAKLKSMGCEGITSIEITSISCVTEEGACPKNSVVFEGGSVVQFEMVQQ